MAESQATKRKHDDPMCPYAELNLEKYSFLEKDLELNEMDVLSISCPKTGSTRINEILFAVKIDVDMELFQKTKHADKCFFVDRPYPGREHAFSKLKDMPSPRILKTHLPLRWYKRNIMKGKFGPKAVIAMRNPKDTLVSFFHFGKNVDFIPKDFSWDQYFNKMVIDDKLLEMNMDFNIDFWRLRNHENIHVVKYEDMLSDPLKETKNITNLLGKNYDDEKLNKIVELTSFQKMKSDYAEENKIEKENKNVKNFFRKGEVGDWKNYFSKEQSDIVDRICSQKYAPEDLFFRYE